MGLSRGVGAIQGGNGSSDGEDGGGGDGSSILGPLSEVMGSLNAVSITFASFIFDLFIRNRKMHKNHWF